MEIALHLVHRFAQIKIQLVLSQHRCRGDIMKRQLCAAVEHERVALRLPFELSISVGSVAIDPSENISLDEYFRRADDAMYEMKKINHAERKE